MKRNHDETEAERETMARDEVGRLNRDAMFQLIERHKLFIARRDVDKWRPTVANTGVIEGLEHLGDITVVATDGLQAWFLLPDGRPFVGHIQCFSGKVVVMFSLKKAKPKTTKPRKKKQTIMEQALEVLMKGITR